MLKINKRSLLLGAGVLTLSTPALALSPVMRQALLGDVAGVPQLRATPLRVATFGDSTAAFSSLTTTDVSAWTAAFGAGTTQMTIEVRKLLLNGFYPQAFVVGDGGISGQTTTQMLARSQLAPSTTRKAIEDIIALAPAVVLLRGGSINDLTGFTPPITQANINGVVSRHLQIVNQFNASGIPVIDCGIYGYSGETNTAQVQAALINLNQQLSAYASHKYKFFNIIGITCDPSGVYLPGISFDGTHLNNNGQLLVANLEAAIVTSLFGGSVGPRFPGTNVIPNANLAASSTVAFGMLGTSWQVAVANATRANAKIETINGVVMQTCEFTPSADAALGQIYAPFGVSGGSPTITISAGQIYGLEADFYLAGLGNTAPPAGTFNFRMELFMGTPRNLYAPFEDSGTDAFSLPLSARAVFEPITIPAFGGSQANLTSADYRLSFATTGVGDRTPFKLGVGNPRMILIG